MENRRKNLRVYRDSFLKEQDKKKATCANNDDDDDDDEEDCLNHFSSAKDGSLNDL